MSIAKYRSRCMAPFVARNTEVVGSNTDRVGYYHRGCVYTVLQTIQMHGVCSAVYGTLKNTWKLFDKSRVSFCCDNAMVVQKAT